ncbi:hypothetical protein D3C76_1589680 [compost metagenome]
MSPLSAANREPEAAIIEASKADFTKVVFILFLHIEYLFNNDLLFNVTIRLPDKTVYGLGS